MKQSSHGLYASVMLPPPLEPKAASLSTACTPGVMFKQLSQSTQGFSV